MDLCLVRGCGDIGSAVAYALFLTGHNVVIHDVPDPSFARRGMSFTDAMFEGVASLEGIGGRRTGDIFSVRRMLEKGDEIPLIALGFSKVLEYLRPQVLIDARMNKRSIPDRQLGLARLTVGLGPNFVAGETTDLVVETAWDGLGTVLTEGSSRPLSGEPRPINGYGRERYVYAPIEGRFETASAIGSTVTRGEPIARIGTEVIRSPLDGCLRGITHSGAPVKAGTKVVEVDPRGDPARSFGIAERPQRISISVRNAVAAYYTQVQNAVSRPKKNDACSITSADSGGLA